MQAMQLFNGAAIKSLTSKTGATTNRLMTQREYCLANKVKGAAGKRAFREYLRKNGVMGNQNVSAMLASGQILTTGITVNKTRTGGAIKFITAAKAEEPVSKKAEEVTEEAALKALGLSADDLATVRELLKK